MSTVRMALKAHTQAGHTRAAGAIWQGTGQGTLPIPIEKGTASTWALPVRRCVGRADRAQCPALGPTICGARHQALKAQCPACIAAYGLRCLRPGQQARPAP